LERDSSVGLPSRVPNRGFIYLVTAKHVAVKTKNVDFYIRANTKDGESIIFKGDSGFTWFFHPNETWPSDVAVFHLAAAQEVFQRLDWNTIGVDRLLTEQMRHENELAEGDEVCIVGLFSHHTGKTKNLPIVRMGHLAMVSDEPVHTTLFGDMHAYLIEARSIRGLSGSPVFVFKPTGVGQWSTYLLGLVHGHWDVSPKEIIEATTDDAAESGSVNVGVAIVVPAEKILETINQPELINIRNDLETTYFAQHPPAGGNMDAPPVD
jgi:hypothetical protein